MAPPSARSCPPALLSRVAAIKGQALVGFDQAASVGERVARDEVDLVAADLPARAVVEGCAGDRHLLFTEQFAATVGQGFDGQLQVAKQAGHHAAAAVIQRVGRDTQGVALNSAAKVIQAAGIQLSLCATAEDQAFAVAHVLAAVAQALVAGQQLASVVVQALRRDFHAPATQGAVAVVEGGEGFDQHAAFACVDHTAGVGEQVADVERHVAAIADQRAFIAVVEALRSDINRGAEQDAGAVVQALALQLQQTFALDTALGIEQLARAFEQQAHTRRTASQQARVAVVETGSAHVELITHHTPGAVVDVAAAHVEQQLLADNHAALVIQVCGMQFDIALPGL